MFGILVGTGLVIAGTAVWLHRRHYGNRAMLGCALRRLKANDEQKRQVTSLFDEAQARLAGLRERARSLRGEFIEVLTAPAIDGQRLESLEARLFEIMGEATLVMRQSLTRLHETLEPRQREQLADWIRHASRHHHCHAGCHF